jgi:hypothetical protein
MLRKNADVIELFAGNEIRGVESGKCGVAHHVKAGRQNQPNPKHGALLQGRDAFPSAPLIRCTDEYLADSLEI